MILINISGGLGNQLFQLAFYNLLIENGYKNIRLNISFYKDQYSLLYYLFRRIIKIPDRKFLFEKEFKDLTLDRDSVLKIAFPSWVISKLIMFLNLFIPLKYLFKISSATLINELNYSTLISSNGFLVLDGYWQKSFFINNQESFIRNLLKSKYKDQFLDNPTTDIVIHIRRGDQATKFSESIYTILNLDYYNNAFKLVSRFCEENAKIIICSDDIDWCIKNIREIDGRTDLYYSRSKSMIDDFFLMYNSSFLISSNSTFSWWAGYVGNSKKMIIPKNWYVNQPQNFIFDSTKIIQI
jgi:hypothetical protein